MQHYLAGLSVLIEKAEGRKRVLFHLTSGRTISTQSSFKVMIDGTHLSPRENHGGSAYIPHASIEFAQIIDTPALG